METRAGAAVEAAAAVEPPGAAAGTARAGEPAVAPGPLDAEARQRAPEPGVVEPGAEPPGVAVGAARAAESAVAQEPRAGARAVAQEPQDAAAAGAAAAVWVALHTPGPGAGAGATAPAGALPPPGQRWVEVFRSIRRIYFPGEMIYGTSGTSPGGRPQGPGRAQRARAGQGARVVLPHVVAFRIARRWRQSPGSCSRRIRTAGIVRFLARWRQDSYSVLFSNLVILNHPWL